MRTRAQTTTTDPSRFANSVWEGENSGNVSFRPSDRDAQLASASAVGNVHGVANAAGTTRSYQALARTIPR